MGFDLKTDSDHESDALPTSPRRLLQISYYI